MLILLISKSLTSIFIIKIYNNTVLIIYVDVIGCLLKVECYLLLLLGNIQNIAFIVYIVMEMQ